MIHSSEVGINRHFYIDSFMRINTERFGPAPTQENYLCRVKARLHAWILGENRGNFRGLSLDSQQPEAPGPWYVSEKCVLPIVGFEIMITRYMKATMLLLFGSWILRGVCVCGEVVSAMLGGISLPFHALPLVRERDAGVRVFKFPDQAYI